MYKIKLFTVFFLHIFLFYDLTAQTPSSKCKWVGTVSASFINATIPARNETLTGTVIYEYYSGGFGIEQYILTGALMTWSVAGGTEPNNCVVSSNSFTFDMNNLDSIQVVAQNLIIYDDGRYMGGAGFDLHEYSDAVHTTCENYSTDEPPFLTAAGIGADSSFIEDDIMQGSSSQSFYEYTWNLHKESDEDIKLEVESGEYESWLPSAGRNEDERGSFIVFDAKLVNPDGSTSCMNAKKFVFKLSDVSQEPGVALNFPDEDRAKDSYDIHFVDAPAGGTVSSNKLTLETKGGTETFGKIYSFDWGGWATLKVTAYMPNGDSITGFLSGYPDITEISIPKRTGNSKIADKWKQNYNVPSLNDDNDEEDIPMGDHDKGDGFTLYEEYRGFYEGGKHIFGDPKKKDLFIYTSSFDYLPGIEHFKAITSLNVHDFLNQDEFDVDVREINFNYNEAPHQTDQHGLFINKTLDPGKSYSPIGPPKHVDTVSISDAFLEGTERIHNISHELGHAVRIPHHGPGNDKNRSWQTIEDYNPETGDLTWEYKEDGISVDVRWEDNSTYTRRLTGKYIVAVWGAQHSGFSDCVMRYFCASIYIPGPGSTSNIRYYLREPEIPGLQLCNQQNDADGGYNSRNFNPGPRHGDATNGKCKEKFCVNDNYH